MRKAVIVIAAVIIVYITVKYVDWKRNVYGGAQDQEYGSFTPYDVESFDGKYIAKQVVERRFFGDANMNYVRVDVFDHESGELADSFYAARAWDFWGICWEEDSYNIWTQSADVGIYCYRYEDGTWRRDEQAERPEYIVSRWEAKEAAKEAVEE